MINTAQSTASMAIAGIVRFNSELMPLSSARIVPMHCDPLNSRYRTTYVNSRRPRTRSTIGHPYGNWTLRGYDCDP